MPKRIALRGWSGPTVTPQRIRKYTQSTGDPNPVHVDEDYAKSLGFPSVIAPGGMVVAWIAEYVLSQHTDAALIDVDVRLASPIYPSKKVAMSGWADIEEEMGAAPTQAWHVEARIDDETVATAIATTTGRERTDQSRLEVREGNQC